MSYSWNDMRRMQAAKKAEAKAATQQYLNRGAGQESNLAQLKALYDPDEKLMEGNSVDATSVDPQQFTAESMRAADVLLTALKKSGNELTDAGVKKFTEYLGHHRIGDMVLDMRRPEVLAAAFNRASRIGLFTDGDFKGQTKPATTLTGRDREEQERRRYLADLRAELGEKEFAKRYGNQGSPLGARRPTIVQ